MLAACYCMAVTTQLEAQSNAVTWSGGIGAFIALNDLVSTSEVRARLQPTGAVSAAASFGEAKLWRAHTSIALFTGFRVSPEEPCSPFCAETSSRWGAVAYATAERPLFLGRERQIAVRTGVGIRALLFPSLGSSCDARDTPCSVESELSKRTYAPAFQAGVVRALGNSWGDRPRRICVPSKRAHQCGAAAHDRKAIWAVIPFTNSLKTTDTK